MVFKLSNFNFILKLNHISFMKNYEKQLIIEYHDNNVIFYKMLATYFFFKKIIPAIINKVYINI